MTAGRGRRRALHLEGQAGSAASRWPPSRTVPGGIAGSSCRPRLGTHAVQIDLPGGDGPPAASIRGEVRVGPAGPGVPPAAARPRVAAAAGQPVAGGKYLDIDELDSCPSLIPSRTTQPDAHRPADRRCGTAGGRWRCWSGCWQWSGRCGNGRDAVNQNWRLKAEVQITTTGTGDGMTDSTRQRSNDILPRLRALGRRLAGALLDSLPLIVLRARGICRGQLCR